MPTNIDIKTDLRRGIMASFSNDKFDNPNFKVFIKKATINLELLKENIGIKKYNMVVERLVKSTNPDYSIEKRREDLLTASCLI